MCQAKKKVVLFPEIGLTARILECVSEYTFLISKKKQESKKAKETKKKKREYLRKID